MTDFNNNEFDNDEFNHNQKPKDDDKLKRDFENIKQDVNQEFTKVKKDFQEEGFLKTFFSFDKMITPTIIKILFSIGVFFSIIIGIGTIISGINSYYGGGGLVFLGILALIFLPIFTKVYCELMIIFFKIYEKLDEIEKKL